MNDATQVRLKLAEENAAASAARPNVKAVLVTGSVARGYADDNSDIDTLIYADGTGRWLGFAQLRANKVSDGVPAQGSIELWRFYVDKPFHGQGVAAELMKGAKLRAKRDRCIGRDQLMPVRAAGHCIDDAADKLVFRFRRGFRREVFLR